MHVEERRRKSNHAISSTQPVFAGMAWLLTGAERTDWIHDLRGPPRATHESVR